MDEGRRLSSQGQGVPYNRPLDPGIGHFIQRSVIFTEPESQQEARMPPQTLEQLQRCADLGDLRTALHSICSRFGSVRRLDVMNTGLPARGQAMCFLRMESAEQESRLASELGIGRFGGDLVVVVELGKATAPVA
jgi:hypothetical protein